MFRKVVKDVNSDNLYIKELKKDFQFLLSNHPNDEKLFQEFFEKNPCMVPNDNQIFGETAHGPYLLNLITQPPLSGLFTRIPDFIWLAKDSMHLRPIIIEIEAPGKKVFKKDGTPTADFSHSRNQLSEWRTILSKPENQLKFYNDLNIPKDLRDLIFKPSYTLIYGRREEFDKDISLVQKRAFLMGQDEQLLSYDRLDINGKALWSITSEIKAGRFIAKYVSPTFKVSEIFKEIYNKVDNLDIAIQNSVYMTIKRKAFIIKKINELKKQKIAPWNGEIKTITLGDIKFE